MALAVQKRAIRPTYRLFHVHCYETHDKNMILQQLVAHLCSWL